MNRYTYNKRFNRSTRPTLNISGEIGNNKYLVIYTHPSQYFKAFVGILYGSTSLEGNKFVYLLKQMDTEVKQGELNVPLKLTLPLAPADVLFLPLGFDGVELTITEE